MNKECYVFEKAENRKHTYTFLSKGKNGTIPKIVVFQPMGLLLHNIVLLDYDFDTNTTSDEVNSNNDDLVKVFTTVFQIIEDFLNNYEDFEVHIKANTLIKNKLYHRIIRNNLGNLKEKYRVLGIMEDSNLELFDTEKNYQAFVIKKIITI